VVSELEKRVKTVLPEIKTAWHPCRFVDINGNASTITQSYGTPLTAGV
jgi:hypothetical protein